MKENFDYALKCVLEHEGGYVDHPNDPGGATNYGITIHTLRAWRHNPNLTSIDVRDMLQEEAESIYRENYWDAVQADDLPSGLDLAVFDAAVNKGPKRAARLLQQALGVAADGIIGPITLSHANRSSLSNTLQEFMARRMNHYGRLGHFRTFGLGWSRRLIDVYAASIELANKNI